MNTELEKNKLAKSTLHHLMMNVVWMNVHMAPLPLFEIRAIEGYGARWKADGSQVLLLINITKSHCFCVVIPWWAPSTD